MDYASMAIGSTNNNTLKSMHTIFPATVVSYDEGRHVANLQPLYMYDNGESYPQVQNVPVAKSRYALTHYRVSANTGTGGAGDAAHNHTMSDYPVTQVTELKLMLQPGDLVLCGCSEKSIDSMASKQVHNPQSKRKYDLSDALVLCIL